MDFALSGERPDLLRLRPHAGDYCRERCEQESATRQLRSRSRTVRMSYIWWVIKLSTVWGYLKISPADAYVRMWADD
jgi:hypothetical protein